MIGALRSRVLRLLRRAGVEDADTRELGRRGERAAAKLLRGLGYRVIGRNLLVPMGEADLLCRAPDRETVVVVEVKTRARRAGAPEKSNETAPEASITAHKRQKLVSIARHLARANGWEKVRIDVVAVEFGDGAPVLRHHVDCVRG